MTIRETIDGLMTSDAEQAAFTQDRGEYLADRDMGDVPDDLIDTAFVHYADTTSLENADALAPVVTRVGPVPYSDDDFDDPVEGLAGETQPDPWSLLSFGATTTPDDDIEEDPADLDDQPSATADAVDLAEPAEPTDDLDDAGSASSTSFGEGDPVDNQELSDSEGETPSEDDDPSPDDLDIDPVDAFGERTIDQQPAEPDPDETDASYDEAGDFAHGLIEESTDDEVDPMDLDFD